MHRYRLLKHPAHLLALGFGSGLSPMAPGTCGTLWAWGVYWLLHSRLDHIALGIVIVVTLLLGWWACTVSAELLGQNDPHSIVIDEIVGFWLVLWLWMPASFDAQLLAFVLFRYFDMAKPGPMGWADRVFHGQHGWRRGVGIMLDDLLAALSTLLVLSLLVARGFTR